MIHGISLISILMLYPIKNSLKMPFFKKNYLKFYNCINIFMRKKFKYVIKPYNIIFSCIQLQITTI